MSISGWLFAAMYDRMTAAVERAGLSAQREALLEDATGRVLEIGAGTGANLPYYPQAVLAITLAEPELPMSRRLTGKAREHSRRVQIVNAAAEAMPFGAARFDTVVSTLVLCTVRDPKQALSEIRRLLVPGGRLLFIEHVRSDNPRIARWQDRLNGLNRVVAHGCHCNRATEETIRASGFRVTALHRGELPKAPPFVRPLIVGSASVD